MTAIDPICNMKVDENSAKYVSELGGKKFYFCSSGCKARFDEDPQKYAA